MADPIRKSPGPDDYLAVYHRTKNYEQLQETNRRLMHIDHAMTRLWLAGLAMLALILWLVVRGLFA